MEPQNQVVLGAPECSRAPGGEWCSAPIGSTTITTAQLEVDALRRELDQRFAGQIEQASKKRFETKQTRTQFARNRRYGLAKRHALKEERT